MSMYEFKCNKCKREFTVTSSPEALEKRGVKCPTCHVADVQRIYSPTPVIYKTNGFYTTDNKKDLTK